MGHPYAPSSAAVVGGGFRVDEEAADFRGCELIGVFEGGDDLVDAGHGELVRQGAVTVHLDAVVVAGDVNVMDVEDFGEGGGYATECGFELVGVGFVLFEWLLDGGGFGFDVGEDGGDVGDFSLDGGFQMIDEVVRGREGQGLINLQVQL